MNISNEIHVSQIGENWEVEDISQTLAQADTKEQAIEAAKEAALASGAEKVIVHNSDGQIEREVIVKRGRTESPLQ